jgi:hypothetical protein
MKLWVAVAACGAFVVIVWLIKTYIYPALVVRDGPDRTADYDIWVCLTTVPERLRHPWFIDNLHSLLTLNGTYRVFLTIPERSARSQKKYKIPEEIIQMGADPAVPLHINRIDTDYGPITKLFGALLSSVISNTSLVLVCDDDIHYKPNFVVNMSASYSRNEQAIHTYCNNRILGYQGFMARKNVLLPILEYERPESCFRIDDDFITLVTQKLSIPIVVVDYSFGWRCSMDDRENNHPDWDELNGDDRRTMRKRCSTDFARINR